MKRRHKHLIGFVCFVFGEAAIITLIVFTIMVGWE